MHSDSSVCKQYLYPVSTKARCSRLVLHNLCAVWLDLDKYIKNAFSLDLTQNGFCVPSAQLENEGDDTPDVNNELWLFVLFAKHLKNYFRRYAGWIFVYAKFSNGSFL